MAVFKKKTMRLNEMLETGLVKEGELLRYKNKHEELLAVGIASQQGIQLPNTNTHLSFTGFESLTRSNYHRPCQYTFAPSSISLQDLVNDEISWLDEPKQNPQLHWGLTGGKAALQLPEPLLGSHDETCRICSSGASPAGEDLVRCESCPNAFHQACLALSKAPAAGWHCPACCCSSCGHAEFLPGSEEVQEVPSKAIWVQPNAAFKELLLADGRLFWTGQEAFVDAPSFEIPSAEYDDLWPELAPRIPLQPLPERAEASLETEEEEEETAILQNAHVEPEEATAAEPDISLVAEEAVAEEPVQPSAAPAAEPALESAELPPQEPADVALPEARSQEEAAEEATAAVPCPEMQAEKKALLPAGVDELFDAGKYLKVASASTARDLLRALEDEFPSAQGSAKKAQRLRDVWLKFFPEQSTKGVARTAQLAHIAEALRLVAEGQQLQPAVSRSKPSGLSRNSGQAADPPTLGKEAPVSETRSEEPEAHVCDQSEAETGVASSPIELSTMDAPPDNAAAAGNSQSLEACTAFAAASTSAEHLLEQLEKVFPLAKGSAQRAKPLKDLFSLLFPDNTSTRVNRSSMLQAVAKHLLANLPDEAANPRPKKRPKPSKSVPASRREGASSPLLEPASTKQRARNLGKKAPIPAPIEKAAPRRDLKEEAANVEKTPKGSNPQVTRGKEERASKQLEPVPTSEVKTAKRVKRGSENQPASRRSSRCEFDNAEKLPDFPPPDPEPPKRRKVEATPKSQAGAASKAAPKSEPEAPGEPQEQERAPKSQTIEKRRESSQFWTPQRLSRSAAKAEQEELDKALAASLAAVKQSRAGQGGKKSGKKQKSTKVSAAEQQEPDKKAVAGKVRRRQVAVADDKEAIKRDHELALALSRESQGRATRRSAALEETPTGGKPQKKKARIPQVDGAYDSDSAAPAGLPAAELASPGPSLGRVRVGGMQSGGAAARPAPLQGSPGMEDEGMRLFDSWLTEPISPVPVAPSTQPSGPSPQPALSLDTAAAESKRQPRGSLPRDDGLEVVPPSRPNPQEERGPELTGRSLTHEQPSTSESSRPGQIESSRHRAAERLDVPAVRGEAGAGALLSPTSTQQLLGSEFLQQRMQHTGGLAELLARVRQPASNATAPSSAPTSQPQEPTCVPPEVAIEPPAEAPAAPEEDAENSSDAAPFKAARARQRPLAGKRRLEGGSNEEGLAGRASSRRLEGEPYIQVASFADAEDLNAIVESPSLATAATDIQPTFRSSPPVGSEAASVECIGCGRRAHMGCLHAEHRVSIERGNAWYCSEACAEVSRRLAALAAQGLLRCCPRAFGVPLAWQLIRGCAVSAPQTCEGFVPEYAAEVRQSLQAVLLAARHILAESCGPLLDARTHQDIIPDLLRGSQLPGAAERSSARDLRGFHTAILWAGSAVIAVGFVRALGTCVAEIPLVCVRPEAEGLGLRQLLLRNLEAALIRCGVRLAVMPAPHQHDPKLRSEEDPAVAGAVASYSTASEQDMRQLAALPLFLFPGTALLAKELSSNSLTQADLPVFGQELSPLEMKAAKAAPFFKAGLLQPVS